MISRFSQVAAIALFLSMTLTACQDTGFRDLDTRSRSEASESTAREVLAQVQTAIKLFYQEKHHYPMTSEVRLYDSIHNYFANPLDPTHLYRNNGVPGYFIAIGNRASQLIYRYPATVGSGDYTLYWVGPNGVDEEGEGDDVDAWEAALGKRPFERRRTVDLIGYGTPVVVSIVKTGIDLYKDSIALKIKRNDTLLYADSWPINSYFAARPDISEADRKRLLHFELERFLNPSEFVTADSILNHAWGTWGEYSPNAEDASELLPRDAIVFNYYSGVLGTKGIAWSPARKRFITVWKTR